mgnify:CR=1 FL=1
MSDSILVIGGGIAGLMAGIRAGELGAKVVVAEKGHTFTSGAGGLGNDRIGGGEIEEQETQRGEDHQPVELGAAAQAHDLIPCLSSRR